MSRIIVSEVPSISTVADDEELNETQQCLSVTIARIGFVIHDLLHSTAWANRQRFKLNLHHWNTIYEQHYIIAVMAVLGVNA